MTRLNSDDLEFLLLLDGGGGWTRVDRCFPHPSRLRRLLDAKAAELRTGPGPRTLAPCEMRLTEEGLRRLACWEGRPERAWRPEDDYFAGCLWRLLQADGSASVLRAQLRACSRYADDFDAGAADMNDYLKESEMAARIDFGDTFEGEALEEVRAWRTGDGKVFTDRDDALAHRRRLAFARWYGERPLFGGNSRVAERDLVDWLEEGRAEVLALLGEAP